VGVADDLSSNAYHGSRVKIDDTLEHGELEIKSTSDYWWLVWFIEREKLHALPVRDVFYIRGH